MSLKVLVEEILKEKNRSMTWLAVEMGKSTDGLRLSLIRKSIKFTDIQKMAVVLEVPAGTFFREAVNFNSEGQSISKSSEPDGEYTDLKSSLKSCKEMVSALKDQLKDKEKIISLLSKG